MEHSLFTLKIIHKKAGFFLPGDGFSMEVAATEMAPGSPGSAGSGRGKVWRPTSVSQMLGSQRGRKGGGFTQKRRMFHTWGTLKWRVYTVYTTVLKVKNPNYDGLFRGYMGVSRVMGVP